MPRIPANPTVPKDVKTKKSNAKKPKPKPPEPPPTPPASPVQVIERRIETVTVDVPLGEPPHDFSTLHVEARLTGRHAHMFARLRQALHDTDAKLDNGRPANSRYGGNPDILRWLLEQLEC